MISQQLIAKEIADNPHILHLELGAGCGNFGQKFYPHCFLSDNESKSLLKANCKECYVTMTFPAHNIPAPDNRFTKIIICNPYGYGFRDIEAGTDLLKEVHRVLQTNGKIILLGSKTNIYTNRVKIQKCLDNYHKQKNKDIFTINEKNIDASVDYKGHLFYFCDRKNTTSPTIQIELLCQQ